MKNLVILGVSGSIGTQTLNVIKNNKFNLNLVAITFGENLENIDYILKSFPTIKYIYIKKIDDYLKFKKIYSNINFCTGKKGIIDLLNKVDFDFAINALSGFIGVEATLNILNQDKKILLANKESLVIAGELIKKSNKITNIIPLDSEHSAIFKLYKYAKLNNLKIKKVFITASGGPFYKFNKEQLKNVTVEEALNHPNFKMGKKISVDSATMLNKTFEIIEAHYLFNLKNKDIIPIIDRKSYIHSFALLNNGDYILITGVPSMIEPITFAFNEYFNKEYNFYDLEINTLNNYQLFKVSEVEFPLLKYSNFVINTKLNSGAILNAASEIAVKNFLNFNINFTQISEIIDIIMNTFTFKKVKDYTDLEKINEEVINFTNKLIGGI